MRNQYLSLLIQYTWPMKWRLGLLSLLVLLSTGLQLVGPQILRYFIDAATTQITVHLHYLAALFLGVALITQAVSVFAFYVTFDVAWRATNRLRYDLIGHCIDLDMTFHNSHTPGELIERIEGDTSELTSFLAQLIIVLIINGLLLVGILALLFRIHWLPGISLTCCVTIALLVLWRLRNIAVPHWVAAQQAQAVLNSYMEERLVGANDIRALGAIPYVMQRFSYIARQAFRTEVKAGLLSGIAVNATMLIFAIATAIGLCVSVYLYRQDAISIGTAFLIFLYAGMLGAPIQIITDHINYMQQATAAIERTSELFNVQSAVQDGPGKALPPGPPLVELDRITFGYDPVHPVLHDLSLRVEPGQVLGLLGPTGHGKTTIARLLIRLHDPQKGNIRIAGQDIQHLHRNQLVRLAGFVTQNVQLFAATVRDNVTLFDHSVPDKDILQIIDKLGLGQWLQALPLGLDTWLPSGGGLSAGEAQLLAFARVLLRDPQLIILDEASSRIDPATETLINRTIRELIAGRTAIIIAHRLETIQLVDTIAIIEQGRIIEHGERALLAKQQDSRFYALLRGGLDVVER